MIMMKSIHGSYGLGISGQYSHYTSVFMQDEYDQENKTFYNYPQKSTLGFNTVSYFSNLLKREHDIINVSYAKEMIIQSYLSPKQRNIHPDLFFGTKYFSRITHLWDYNIIENILKHPNKQLKIIENNIKICVQILKSQPMILIVLIIVSFLCPKNGKYSVFIFCSILTLIALYSIIQIRERFLWCTVPLFFLLSINGLCFIKDKLSPYNFKIKLAFSLPLILISLYPLFNYLKYKNIYIEFIANIHNNINSNELFLSKEINTYSKENNLKSMPLIGVGTLKANLIGFHTDKLIVSNNINLKDFKTHIKLISSELSEFLVYSSNGFKPNDIIKVLKNLNIECIDYNIDKIHGNFFYCRC
jgi:hypothetical protein